MWSKKELVDNQAEFWVVLARGATLQAPMRPTSERWRLGLKRLNLRWTRHTATDVPWCVIPTAMSSRSRTGWPAADTLDETSTSAWRRVCATSDEPNAVPITGPWVVAR